MGIRSAIGGSASGDLVLITLALAALKLAAAALQVALSRGDFRATPNSTLYRIAYAVGKVAPPLAACSACLAAFLRHDRANTWFLGLFAILVAAVAFYVVRLRRQGRFFGLFDLLRNRRG